MKKEEKKPIPRTRTTTFFEPMPEHQRIHHHDAHSVNTTVNVTVNEKEEGEVSGCFKALFSCASKAK